MGPWLRLRRPDSTFQTCWRQAADSIILDDPALEAVLPEAADLATITPPLLISDALPGLWHGPSLPIHDVVSYFAYSSWSCRRLYRCVARSHP
jgi:hypothetical protein